MTSVLLKWIILVILILLVITDGCRFCNIKETDSNHARWQSFQFRFNSSAEIVCNQPNFSRKMFVISRILSEFFLVYAIIRLIRISANFFPAIRLVQIPDWGSIQSTARCRLSTRYSLTELRHERATTRTQPTWNALKNTQPSSRNEWATTLPVASLVAADLLLHRRALVTG